MLHFFFCTRGLTFSKIRYYYLIIFVYLNISIFIAICWCMVAKDNKTYLLKISMTNIEKMMKACFWNKIFNNKWYNNNTPQVSVFVKWHDIIKVKVLRIYSTVQFTLISIIRSCTLSSFLSETSTWKQSLRFSIYVFPLNWYILLMLF